jgi:hypothetical protein
MYLRAQRLNVRQSLGFNKTRKALECLEFNFLKQTPSIHQVNQEKKVKKNRLVMIIWAQLLSWLQKEGENMMQAKRCTRMTFAFFVG